MSDRRRTTRAARRYTVGSFDSVASPEIGSLVGDKYRVVDWIGEGAMGVVLRGRDEQLERDVAIKLIRPDWAANPGFQQHFLAEARTMARINHQNVVAVLDFGWTGQTPYIVMEYIDGRDLDGDLERMRFPLDDALRIVVQICHGVEAIHEAGAVHRDLKPGNVLLGTGSRVVVGDFGLAIPVTMAGSEPSPGGTPGFLAPEIAAKNLVGEEIYSGPLLSRADVYALGSIAYEMLTGTPAFMGDTVEEILGAQFEGEVQPPSTSDPELASAFDGPILEALARDPTQRTASVTQFRQALERAMADARDPSYGRRVVVVDPDADALDRLGTMLHEAFPHAEIERLASGVEALRGLTEQSADLLVLEPAHGELSAEAVVRALRREPEWTSLAIVIASNEIGPPQWQALRAAGADGFVMKPVDPVQLVALARSLFEDPTRRRVPGLGPKPSPRQTVRGIDA